MMKLLPKLISGWPKLAWVAKLSIGSETIEVLHGPMVETDEDWCVEAVWAGDFAKGDFDQTELVFGSGIRCRGDRVVFVTSGTMFDRLWYCHQSGTYHVANSLPAILAVAGLSLRDEYQEYMRDMQSVATGLRSYVQSIPTDGAEVSLVYFNNLVYDGSQLRGASKPDTAPPFRQYSDYWNFLTATSKCLGTNFRSPRRCHQVSPLASISSGYDSTAAAVVASVAGCSETVSIKKSTSLWRGSDSGKSVARVLKMNCKEYPRSRKSYPLEEAVWAAEARPGILNWTQFDFPEPLCVFFTGCHGEKVWDRVDHDDPDPFVRRDTASLGFSEYRLHKGVFQCVVPFWGVRHSAELKAITLSEEMDPWKTNRDYDKPIARRILSEAEVPGDLFGARKKNTSHEAVFLWPYSQEAKTSFERFLQARNVFAPPGPLIWLVRRLAHLDQLVAANLLKKIRLDIGLRYRMRFRANSMLFQWANAELKSMYQKGLMEAGR